jgi:S-adenosylmethionine/arginine decarboxylase-like enzyme
MRKDVSVHTHLLIEYYGCKVDFSSPEVIQGIVDKAAKDADIRIVKSVSHRFEPTGSTILRVLEESHIALHTYEEDKNRLSVCAYVCGKTYAHGRKKAHVFHRNMIKLIKPKHFDLMEVKRGFDRKNKKKFLEVVK